MLYLCCAASPVAAEVKPLLDPALYSVRTIDGRRSAFPTLEILSPPTTLLEQEEPENHPILHLLDQKKDWRDRLIYITNLLSRNPELKTLIAPKILFWLQSKNLDDFPSLLRSSLGYADWIAINAPRYVEDVAQILLGLLDLEEHISTTYLNSAVSTYDFQTILDKCREEGTLPDYLFPQYVQDLEKELALKMIRHWGAKALPVHPGVPYMQWLFQHTPHHKNRVIELMQQSLKKEMDWYYMKPYLLRCMNYDLDGTLRILLGRVGNAPFELARRIAQKVILYAPEHTQFASYRWMMEGHKQDMPAVVLVKYFEWIRWNVPEQVEQAKGGFRQCSLEDPRFVEKYGDISEYLYPN